MIHTALIALVDCYNKNQLPFPWFAEGDTPVSRETLLRGARIIIDLSQFPPPETGYGPGNGDLLMEWQLDKDRSLLIQFGDGDVIGGLTYSTRKNYERWAVDYNGKDTPEKLIEELASLFSKDSLDNS